MPPLSDFLTALPALLQAISQRVLRALLALVVRVAKLASDLATAVTNFFVRIVKWVWHLYCRLELSIVDALSFVLITVWSLRLFALLLAPAVLLAIFHYWIAAAVYMAVLGVAIWRFYTAKAEEVETAAQDQAPIRAFLNKILGWGLRALLLALTFVSAALFFSSSTAGTTAQFKEQWNRVLGGDAQRVAEQRRQETVVLEKQESEYQRRKAEEKQVAEEQLRQATIQHEQQEAEHIKRRTDEQQRVIEHRRPREAEPINKQPIIFDDYDEQQLQNVFELRKSGTENSWVNTKSGIRYFVIPKPTYEENYSNMIVPCRQAELSLTTKNGTAKETILNACRQNGKWVFKEGNGPPR